MSLLVDDASTLPMEDNLNKSSGLIIGAESRDSDDGLGLGSTFPVSALNSITSVTAEALTYWPAGERHLLNHFLLAVSRALVLVDDHENPFLTEIVPMAFEYASVRHSLLALSACHLSKVYPNFEGNVLGHRSMAYLYLRPLIETQSEPVAALTTTLLLCLLEICEGDSTKWILHLHGARALVSPFRQRPTFLTDLYEFLSCTASITSIKQITSKEALPIGLVLPLSQAISIEIHPFFGIGRAIYDTLNQVNHLAHQLASMDRNSPSEAYLLSTAENIEKSLQTWPPPNHEAENTALREVTALAIATKWAALMRLHQVVSGYNVTHPKVKAAVTNILSAVSIIRPGSKTEAHILFPLFMAGVGSAMKSDRLTVEYRLRLMETIIGFGNINGAHRALNAIWQRMNAGEMAINWLLLLETSYPEIVLF